MQINTSTNYAINIMLYLARNKRTVSSSELSQSVAVSKRYLMQIAAKLRDGEMIGVNKGLIGGYFLIKEPIQVSIYDIIILMEGSIQILNDTADIDAHHTLRKAFADLQNRINQYLRSLTLEVLINQSWPECLKLLTDSMEPYNKSLSDGVLKDT